MPDQWISANPRYDGILRDWNAGTISATLVNCASCGGVGRTIIVDSNGQQYSVTCQSCGGAGQKDNGDGQ